MRFGDVSEYSEAGEGGPIGSVQIWRTKRAPEPVAIPVAVPDPDPHRKHKYFYGGHHHGHGGYGGYGGYGGQGGYGGEDLPTLVPSDSVSNPFSKFRFGFRLSLRRKLSQAGRLRRRKFLRSV